MKTGQSLENVYDVSRNYIVKIILNKIKLVMLHFIAYVIMQ